MERLIRGAFPPLLLGCLFSLAVAVLRLEAQGADATIGRNIPGSVPNQAPDLFPRLKSPIDVEPELPVVPSYGVPGEGILRRVIFSGALSPDQRRDGFEVTPGVTSDRVDLIESDRRFAALLSSDFIGKPFSSATVSAIVEAGLKFYFKAERPIVLIQPTQIDFDRGVLKLTVIETKLGEKESRGARWFGGAFLLSNIRTRPGQPINRMKLLNDLEWLNQNPFMQSRVVLDPGKVPGTTDVIVETEDRFPVRAFVGVDNTGTEQSGVWRWNVGANWGNAFFIGHQLSLQFSAAFDNIASQPVYSANYIAPLPWHHRVSVYGSYAGTDIDLDLGAGGTVAYRGYQAQVSPRYAIPIGKLYGKFTHEVSVGFDWKSTDLNFVQGGDAIPSNQTAVEQFVAGYNANLQDAWGTTSLSVEAIYSPGGIGASNTDQAFQDVDPRLQANYFYGVLTLDRSTKLPWNFSLVHHLEGQLASTSLISSEQLSIGGWGTVRGYDERVLFGDQGLVLSMELRSPPVVFLRRFFPGVPEDRVTFLAFWDFGLVNTISPLPGDPATSTLTSVGVGVRYQLAGYVSARCDLGFPLIDPDLGFPVDTAAVCVGVTLAY